MVVEAKRGKEALEWMLDALFPRFCVRCEREGATLCSECDEAFLPTPSHETAPIASLATLTTGGPYGDPTMRRLIGAWKYDGDAQAAAAIAKRVRRALYATAPHVVDAVTWVPLSAERFRAREFDQAEAIALAAGETLGVPCLPLLKRTLHTPPRSRVGRTDRRFGDLDGVFEVADPRMLSRILLCDDVFTSGATMAAAARTLRDAGAKEIHGFAVAKG
ncbi:hypothetical protein A2856_00110 [Candidatus Uhrbacteria bacterium RIFCSPHIGHO2_01_FULL_63_20]|uniref:Phosphoribosyltransferase domain-containing protein n=1 Tax=Candidatus Uhrbacteria bacterium RIFCSPHIGHO2_01_FULL_63_20 TaxID=1802385 RepID=A0A1F7TMZ3_9BACT|nr:MAG: hypothetical protein A2856_00110 [Candidatus Uhrbacteria bacterium RIFCSPHIGHO2_01_FULL_63_20]